MSLGEISSEAPSSLHKGDLVLLNLEGNSRELVIFLEYNQLSKRRRTRDGIIECRVMAVEMVYKGKSMVECGQILDNWGFDPGSPKFVILSRFIE